MAGEPNNAALWEAADVYIAPVGSTEPVDVTAAWDAAWDAVGLLDGEAGLAESREEDSTDYFAWGGTLVKRARGKHKRTLKFVALEDNDTVFSLVNPGSTRSESGGLTTSTVKVPKRDEFALGLEVRDGDKVKRRMAKRAEVQEVGEIKEAEGDMTVYEITVVIYPESDGTLYTELSGTA